MGGFYLSDKTTIEVTKNARNSLFWLKKRLHARSYSDAILILANRYKKIHCRDDGQVSYYELACNYCSSIISVKWDGKSSGYVVCPRCGRLNEW